MTIEVPTPDEVAERMAAAQMNAQAQLLADCVQALQAAGREPIDVPISDEVTPEMVSEVVSKLRAAGWNAWHSRARSGNRRYCAHADRDVIRIKFA